MIDFETEYSSMKIRSKPTNFHCNLAIYILFLLSEPKYVSCVRLSEILDNLSHDSVNGFLVTQKYDPQDLFNLVQEFIVF